MIKALEQRIHERLELHLTDTQKKSPSSLNDALRYTVLNGGKCLRPLLVYTTGMSLGATEGALDNVAVAVELIHCYSLVHDDLPAMDDDDLRRGKPSCHKAFDEATAILVGDALQSLAFEVLAEPNANIDAQSQRKMIHLLAQASGRSGMVGGQLLDIISEQSDVSRTQLEHIHAHKTGALITASILLGAIAANCTDETSLSTLTTFGNTMGLAFQIKDDLLDIESNAEALGKNTQADAKLKKATYPSIVGIEESHKILDALNATALSTLNQLQQPMGMLKTLFNTILHRQT